MLVQVASQQAHSLPWLGIAKPFVCITDPFACRRAKLFDRDCRARQLETMPSHLHASGRTLMCFPGALCAVSSALRPPRRSSETQSIICCMPCSEKTFLVPHTVSDTDVRVVHVNDVRGEHLEKEQQARRKTTRERMWSRLHSPRTLPAYLSRRFLAGLPS
ncbi:uncharacterized protein PHACADRAFT_253426 [Phanerochaete carnosa HHB-10118-sp]|uniref:Uncharacterized protein n=1 Tax=Phanerochaete carnosa (strain HHB-10118-sp) TaxID=650164 RepID=K5VXS0_PHACS|nr:uncharacterized protein PHACADRAFT_253426 [Phanerochaete carnosa HHB-10118-sp]EKM56358.1 hypothetical protein PHACADRAFT_253426 [Phanerochaete carnosa HHB-10118-sp]